MIRTGCGGPVLSFSNHLAANLSGRRDSRGIVRIGNGRKRNNLRDNIFAVTQMLEIADLLCFYKTNNLHIFRTETFYHLNPKLPLTSRSASKKKLKYPHSQGALNFSPNHINAKDVPGWRFWISDCGFKWYSVFEVLFSMLQCGCHRRNELGSFHGWDPNQMGLLNKRIVSQVRCEI